METIYCENRNGATQETLFQDRVRPKVPSHDTRSLGLGRSPPGPFFWTQFWTQTLQYAEIRTSIRRAERLVKFPRIRTQRHATTLDVTSLNDLCNLRHHLSTDGVQRDSPGRAAAQSARYFRELHADGAGIA